MTRFRHSQRPLLAPAAFALLIAAGVPWPVAAQRGPCVGDCAGDGAVTVDDLIRGVNIALGNRGVGDCPSFDVDGDGQVAINELVQAVNAALNGCLSATPTMTAPPATPTATASASGSPTATATVSPTGTTTVTPTFTDTPTATESATPTSTATPTITETPTVTATPAHTPRPNILVINLDDTRFDGIDRMAAFQARVAGDGVSFAESFVPNAVCCPSRASLLSGLYSIHHGTRTVGGVIGGADTFRESGQDRETIAVWLRDRGYTTGLFGKYLNDYSTTEQDKGPGGTFYVPPGWDRWRAFVSPEHYGGVHGETYTIVDEAGARTVYDDHTSDAQYSTDLLAAWMRDFIAETAGGDQPFFALWTPYASHGDSIVPAPAARHDAAFADLLPWRPPNWNEADVSDKARFVAALPPDPFGGAFTDGVRRLAYQSLLAVDEQIALTLEQLASLGVDRQTVVILTSDNGTGWGEHRLFSQAKGCPYEECLRVPMIVRDPRRHPGGPITAEQPALNIDLAPTIAELAGFEVPVAIDGRSFAPWLGTAAPPPPARGDFLIESFRQSRNDPVDYTGQVADGDRLRLFYGNTRARPRASVVFEFDAGGGVGGGAVAVAIGADADASFGNLRSAVVANVPLTGAILFVQNKRLSAVDNTPEHHGVYWWEEVDQSNVMDPATIQPDYLGVRDVARGYTYVEYETGEVELYDLNADPWQLENKAGDPSYAVLRVGLAARLEELLGE